MSKWINGYVGKYKITGKGVVISYNYKKPKALIPSIRANGYFGVSLAENNTKKTYSIHRLVAESYIKNPNNKPCVNHINGIKHDNNVENLEWVTYSENALHAHELGLNPNCGKPKIPVVAVCILTGKEYSYDFMSEARKDGHILACISRCCNGRNKTHHNMRWQYA